MASVPNDHANASSQQTAFSVAIIGGGIGGLTLALGLLKYPHIDVQIYEAAASFGEIGAGVAIGPNAQRALELIGPEARGAFDSHKTANLWASHANMFAEYRVGAGEHEGEVICGQKNATGMQSVHRAHFLNELVKFVPAQRAHFGKRVVNIKDKGEKEGIVVQFKDGTSATADAVVGADGIHSALRSYVLGETHDAVKPVFAGSVVYRGLVPMDKAIEKVGAEIAQNSMMFCGPGKAVLVYPVDFGKILNIVVMDEEHEHEKWGHEKWIVPASYQELARKFEGWGKPVQGLLELLDTPDLAAWALWDHAPAPFYNKGAVAIMGDAAHATTPFQGQGAGMAIEDALVLETLVGKVASVAQLPNAFAAFDQVRRPRTQKIVTTSREAGELIAMKLPGVGNDLRKMREKLETRMHWIWHRDMVAQNDEAIKKFEESL